MQLGGMVLALLLAAASLAPGCAREPVGHAGQAGREERAALAALTAPGREDLSDAEIGEASARIEAIAAAGEPGCAAELEALARRFSGADARARSLAPKACWALWRTGTPSAWFEREALAAYPERRELCANLLHVAAYDANEAFLERLLAIRERMQADGSWEDADLELSNAVSRYYAVIHLQRRLGALASVEERLAVLAPICARGGGFASVLPRRSATFGRAPNFVWAERRLAELSGASPDVAAAWTVAHDWGEGELASFERCAFLDVLAPACLARVFALRRGWEAELAAARAETGVCG